MIVQFADRVPIGRNDVSVPLPKRFLHDRNCGIPGHVQQPRLSGQLNGKREVYILYFQINPNTVSRAIRIRILNGNMLNFSRGIERGFDDEIAIDVLKNANRQLYICFDCNPIYGSWVLQWGNVDPTQVTDWNFCPVNFDHFALIRSSKPLDENTMELPRFIISPQYGYNPIAEDLRGSVGQPYGRTIRQLKTLQVNFVRVSIDLIDDYYSKVSIHKPHFVVPYPENVEHCPPLWATLTRPPIFTKRGENGWYWNCSLFWREAY